MHKSIREGHFPRRGSMSTKGRENEVVNHLELPLLQYFPDTPLGKLSSLSSWSLFLEQAPPIEKVSDNQFMS